MTSLIYLMYIVIGIAIKQWKEARLTLHGRVALATEQSKVRQETLRD